MKHRFTFVLFTVVVLFSMMLASCQPSAPATEAPAAPPAAPPAEAPAAPAYEPMVVSAESCDYGGEFKSIEALDEYTVKFTLCYPDPAFPSKVAFSVFSILDKDHLDATQGDSVKISDQPNGTGPYKVTEWKRGDSVTLEAYPDYWGEKAKTKTLIFRWSAEAAQRFLELQSGTADGIDNPATEDWEAIESDANLKLYPRDGMNIFYIGFNHDLDPFKDEKVRQAFAMAIDRQRIVDQYYPKGSTVAVNFVPPALVPGASPDVPWYDYNPQQAKTMLEEAGFDFKQEIELSYRNVVRAYLPNPVVVGQEIQAQLAEIGVKVKLNEMESTTFLDATAAGEKPFYLLGWNADYPDASNFFDYHFAAETNLQFGTLFEDIVKEIRAGGQTANQDERQMHYTKVNELLKKHVPMIPVAHGGSGTAFKASVKGAHSSPLGNERFSVMETGTDQLVWVQNGEPAALWCSDETDGETLRACEQVYEPLLSFVVGGAEVEPALAETYESNEDLTEWTFTLRRGVKFHDGAALDANDVVATYASLWDASSPNHVGRTGNFEYFTAFFGTFINAPK